MWGAEQLFRDDKLNFDIFNTHRNWVFWSLLYKYFPRVRICVDERIKAHMIQYRPPGMTYKEADNLIIGDRVVDFQHDKHVHIEMGDEINWDANI